MPRNAPAPKTRNLRPAHRGRRRLLRPAECTAARAGEPEEIDPEELDARVAWGVLKPEEVLPPKPAPEVDPVLTEGSRPPSATSRLSKTPCWPTHARGCLSTRTTTTCRRRCSTSPTRATRKIGVLEDPSLNYLGMLSPLVGVVKGQVNEFFPEDALFRKLGSEAAAGGLSQVQSKYHDSLTSGNADLVQKAGEMVESMAQEVGNYYSGAFLKRQKTLSVELGALVTTNSTVRRMLADGGLDNLNQIVTEYLGVPDPDEESLYKTLRVELEAELAGWIAYQTSSSRWLGVKEEEAKQASAEARSEATAAADRRNPKLDKQ